MCDGRYIDNYRNTYKDRGQNKDQYRDYSYDKNRNRSKGKHCSYDDRKDDSFDSKLERLNKILQLMNPDKVMAITFILANSENFADMIDRIHSLADVDHLIDERIAYVKSQKTKSLTKEIHNNDDSTNSQNNHASYEMINAYSTQDSANYETIDSNTCSKQDSLDSEMIEFDTSLTQHSVDSESIDIDPYLGQDSEKNTEIIQDIEVPIEFIEGKIENYSTEPSITYESEGFQSIDECKTIDIQDEQEIEECIVSETVELPDIPIRDIEEQEIEECIEEVVSDMTLPKLCSADEKLHTDEVK